MADTVSWEKLKGFEVFGHSWLPGSLSATASRPKVLLAIWGLFGLLPLAVYAGTALLYDSFYLEGDQMGLMEDLIPLLNAIYVPALVSASVIVFPRLPKVLHTLRGVIAQAGPYTTGTEDLRIDATFLEDEQTEQIIRDHCKVDTFHTERSLSLTFTGWPGEISSVAYAGAYRTESFHLKRGRVFVDDGEAIISESLSHTLDCDDCDFDADTKKVVMMDARWDGKSFPLKIVGVYAENPHGSDESPTARFTLGTIRNHTHKSERVGQFALTLKEGAEPKRVSDELLANSDNDFRILLCSRMTAAQFDEILSRHGNMILGEGKSKLLAVALFLGVTLWVGLVAKDAWFEDAWYSRDFIVSYVVRMLYTTLVGGLVVGFLIFKLLMIIYVMRSVSVELTRRGVMRVRPMSPDKAGGLGAQGAYSLQLVLLLLVPLIFIVPAALSDRMTVAGVLATALYILLLIFAFFYPLSGAHRAMRDAKATTLQVLSRRFNRIYDIYMTDIDTSRSDTLKKRIEEADTLDKLYKQAQAMPVWPFNLATLSRFGGILLSVFITVWLKFIVGWASGFGR